MKIDPLVKQYLEHLSKEHQVNPLIYGEDGSDPTSFNCLNLCISQSIDGIYKAMYGEVNDLTLRVNIGRGILAVYILLLKDNDFNGVTLEDKLSYIYSDGVPANSTTDLQTVIAVTGVNPSQDPKTKLPMFVRALADVKEDRNAYSLAGLDTEVYQVINGLLSPHIMRLKRNSTIDVYCDSKKEEAEYYALLNGLYITATYLNIHVYTLLKELVEESVALTVATNQDDDLMLMPGGVYMSVKDEEETDE